MVESLVEAFKPFVGQPHPIKEIVLIPSGGGRFEVTVNDEVVYSKAETGKHTSNDYIVQQVRARL